MRIAHEAERWHGILALDELRECGLTRQAIAGRARRGSLHRVYPGVYAVGHRALSSAARLIAAVKAAGAGAVLSHRSAAELWGMLEPRPPRAWPEVTIPGRNRRRIGGLRVHTSQTLVPDDIHRREGIPVTGPERTIIDLAAVAGVHVLRRAIREAVGSRITTFTAVVAAANRTGSRRGIGRLRRVLLDGVPTRSELEHIVLRLLIDSGFGQPHVNVPIRVGDRTLIPDFRWPVAHLIVEADGAAWHDNPQARRADRDRQRLLEAHGERVERVSWRQAVAEPAATVERLRAAGAPSALEAAIGQPGVD